MTAPAIIPASQIEEWIAGYRELASHSVRARQNLAFAVAMTRDDHERVARTIALVRALTEPAPTTVATTAPAPTQCHYGTLGCRDRSDGTHECRPVRTTLTPAEFPPAPAGLLEAFGALLEAERTPRCVRCRRARDYGSWLCERCEDEADREREGDLARVRDYGDSRL